MPIDTSFRLIRTHIEEIDPFGLLRNIYRLGILRNPYLSLMVTTLTRFVSLRSFTEDCKKTCTFKNA